MLNKKVPTDYYKFSFEDFLQDDYFIQSIRFPDEESLFFWQKYINERPANLEIYNEACFFLRKIEEEEQEKNSISEREKVELWQSIQSINKGKKKSTHLKKMTYYGVAMVASFVLLLGFALSYFREMSKDIQQESILSFVEANRDISSESQTTTRLLLSDAKEITLVEEEAVITYDSSAIYAGKEEISKKEVASFNQLIVPKGKRSLLTLSDGTKVWVNAYTKLVYPTEFLPDKREIYVNGEIYLEVTPDKNRPFIVKTKNTDIQVLGTSFNVSSYENDLEMNVVLASGAVKIISQMTQKESLLKPSEKYAYTEGIETIEKVDISHYISWKDGFYICDSETLDVILLRLSRYYGTEIVCDPAVSKQLCTGKLDLKESIEQILSDISYTIPISYTKMANGQIYIHEKNRKGGTYDRLK